MSRRCASRGYCLAAALLLAAVFPAAADRQEDLQVLRARIERLQSELAGAESSRGEAADALRASEKAISEVNRSLYELGRDRQALNVNLNDINQRIQAGSSDVSTQKHLLDALVRHQYMHGGSEGLRLILEGRDLAAVDRRLHYYGYIARLRTEMIRRLQAGLDTLTALQAEALRNKADIAANEDEQKRAKKSLEAEKLVRKKVLDRIAGEIVSGRREIGRLKRDEDRLAKLVEQLGRMLDSAPAQRIRKPGQPIDDVADSSFVGKAFQALKGKLKLPVRGELSSRFGNPREEGGTTWKGLFIRSDAGQQVRAVADGRVVYADWLRGFGNLLILDHGAGYMSLYGNNESVLKQVGEVIQSGEAVASVGDSGGAGESGLYFELRYRGKAFDPLKWVGK